MSRSPASAISPVTRASISITDVRESLSAVTGASFINAGFAMAAPCIAKNGGTLAWKQTVSRFVMRCAISEKHSASLSPTSPRPNARAEFLELWASRKLTAELPDFSTLDVGDLWRRRERSLERCDLPFARRRVLLLERHDLPLPWCLLSCKSVGQASSSRSSRTANDRLTITERPLGV
jgi:hypothetical protein